MPPWGTLNDENVGRIANPPYHGRLFLRQQVYEAILSGEIIEDYPDDVPYPSCLVFGRTRDGRPVHVVCAHVPEDTAIIITVYEPDPDRWTDFRRRILP